jgi:hypothetical protein
MYFPLSKNRSQPLGIRQFPGKYLKNAIHRGQYVDWEEKILSAASPTQPKFRLALGRGSA